MRLHARDRYTLGKSKRQGLRVPDLRTALERLVLAVGTVLDEVADAHAAQAGAVLAAEHVVLANDSAQRVV